MNRAVNRHFLYNPVLAMRGEWLYGDLSFFKASQYYSQEKIRIYQNKKLKKLLNFARKYSQYYQNYLPSNIDNNQFKEIGFIDKKVVRESANSLRTNRGVLYRTKTTGGSTGAAVTVIKNARAMRAELAAAWRGFSWAGVNIGDRQVRFWGVPQSNFRDKVRARLIDFICNRYRVSAFGFDSNSWKKSVSAIKRFDPDYFYGYVSIIREFADYIKCNDMIGAIRPKAIITTSEVLTEFDRDIISNVFGCRVYNEYGCGEVNTIAHECEHGSLHLNSENLIVEIINEKGSPQPPGNAGEIVLTDLNNYAMPLIRYKLSDWGVISSSKCRCGRRLPIIENVYGRAYDAFTNRDGKSFHGEFFLYIIEDANKNKMQIDGIQFIQESNNNITVKIVCDIKIIEPLGDFIKRRLREGFDNSIPIKIEKVDNILREKSGKIRVVKRCR